MVQQVRLGAGGGWEQEGEAPTPKASRRLEEATAAVRSTAAGFALSPGSAEKLGKRQKAGKV